MEDGLQVDSIYTDFSKAFDKERHQLLLVKLALAVPPDRCGLLRSPAEHNELGSEAAFRKRSKSRRWFLRVAIWAHYASSGLSMTLLRFSNTYEFFFIPMT
jgi:hypothetical protein